MGGTREKNRLSQLYCLWLTLLKEKKKGEPKRAVSPKYSIIAFVCACECVCGVVVGKM